MKDLEHHDYSFTYRVPGTQAIRIVSHIFGLMLISTEMAFTESTSSGISAAGLELFVVLVCIIFLIGIVLGAVIMHCCVHSRRRKHK